MSKTNWDACEYCSESEKDSDDKDDLLAVLEAERAAEDAEQDLILQRKEFVEKLSRLFFEFFSKRKTLLLALIFLIPNGVKSEIVTAFCACKKCCGTGAKGITASGKKPVQGVTIAAPVRYKFGSQIKFVGIDNIFTVQDRTAKRFGNRFDIFMNSHDEALKFGIKKNFKIEFVK